MSYAIVGFGKIGQALAHAFARKNIEVTVASRRPPEALAPEARAIGPTVVAKSLRDALEADTIILAVPFGEIARLRRSCRVGKGKGEISMSIEKNVQIVKNFLAALDRRDKQGLLALSAEDIEWIVPGEDWPLAGTHRGHAGLENLLQKANETVETSYPEPPEFIAQGDRVLVVGFATGRIKATNRKFEDHWVFAITVRNGKLTNVREYIDTQTLARASETAASPRL